MGGAPLTQSQLLRLGSSVTGVLRPVSAPISFSWPPGRNRVAQTVNLGADIFLANEYGCYIGRICHYRKCFPRVACIAQNCGRREHLNDDLQVVSLSKELIAALQPFMALALFKRGVRAW